MLKQLGYFHYGSEQRSSPIGALERAIDEAGGRPKVENSLIVLPEAFNLRVTYEKLKRRCNIARFIPADGPSRTLSKKMARDDASPSIYEPCKAFDEVMEHGNALIAALICKDAFDDRLRRRNLVERIRNCACPILCVPANTYM
jgi:hypothetical protein